MKKLLLILLVLTSLSAMSQTRPPIVTNEIRTNLIKWNDLLMYRDSLVYFRPIDAKSFQVKRPSSSVWSTYDFTEIPDSFFIPDLNVWIVVGQPITQGDSTFYVRQKPNCPNCWQYSYNNASWNNWFCSETGASNLSIDYNADKILGIHYNKGLGAYTDSLYFRAVEADSGKVPTIVGDSVLWRDIPRDSLFDAYSSDWLKGGDTIPKQNDSILYGGEWIVSTKILINDTSKINELDTIVINGQKLGNLDSIWVDTSNINELDSIKINNIWYKNGGVLTLDPSVTNELDSIKINNVWYKNGGEVSLIDSVIVNNVKYGRGENIEVDTCLWGYSPASIFPEFIFSNKSVVINDLNSNTIGSLVVNSESSTFPSVAIDQRSTGQIINMFSNDSSRFSIENDGRMISNGITYPVIDGDSMQVIITDGKGKLSFASIGSIGDSSLWLIDSYGIKSKVDNIGVGGNSMADAVISAYNTQESGTAIIGINTAPNSYAIHANNIASTGDNYGLVVNATNGYSILATGSKGMITDKLSIGYNTDVKYTLPTLDGDSLGVMSTDGNGNVSFRNLISENPPTYTGDTLKTLITSGNGDLFWGAIRTQTDGEVYGDSLPYFQPIPYNAQVWCGTTPCSFIEQYNFELKYQKLKSYEWTLDSAKVYVQTNYGKWTPDTYGMNSDSLNVGIGEASKTATKLNVKALTGEKSAEFNGGDGVLVDKLTVGSGKTITRSGTIASKDIWTGTAAEYAANTVKDGITPQASTTIAFILD